MTIDRQTIRVSYSYRADADEVEVVLGRMAEEIATVRDHDSSVTIRLELDLNLIDGVLATLDIHD